jgi:hypothetical protein
MTAVESSLALASPTFGPYHHVRVFSILAFFVKINAILRTFLGLGTCALRQSIPFKCDISNFNKLVTKLTERKEESRQYDDICVRLGRRCIT